MDIKWIGSPNYDSNRKPIDRIVIHWFGVGKQASADAQFQKPNGTSAHYSIEDNSIHQYVKEENVAYHAGNYAMNQRSIGIEHSAEPDRPATEITYKNSGLLVADICKKYNIPADRQHIIKHSEVKATQCPGTMDLDKIISLAKQNMGTTDKITIDTALYEKLVGNSTAKKDVATYLEIVNPDDASAEEMKRVIGGYKSRITDTQNQLSAAQAEVQNRTEQVSRLKDDLTNKDKMIQELQESAKPYTERIAYLEGQVEALAKEKGALNTELQQCKSGKLDCFTIFLNNIKKLFS